MRTVIIDIETGPLPAEQIEAMMPEFVEADVKLGNIKDPALREAKVAEARARHAKDFYDRAALDARTGRVLAVGFMVHGKFTCDVVDAPFWDEGLLLQNFWDAVRMSSGDVCRIIGFNIKLFDLPFLVRRSWLHHIPYPALLWDGRYWSKNVVDLRDWWQLGDRQAHGSLDSISKFLGYGEKLGNGKDFAALLQADGEQAIAYLQKDLELTQAMAKRFGLL